MVLAKTWPRGFSMSLHSVDGSVNLTYWTDNNAGCFMDNVVPTNPEFTAITVNDRGAEMAIHVPLTVHIYKQVSSCPYFPTFKIRFI